MSARRVAGGAGGASRRRILAAALLALGLLAPGSGRSAAGPEGAGAGGRQQFRAAGRAYEEGRLDEAVRLYEELLRSGAAPLEVAYNLGNARLRGGRPGLAVLNYRRAWRLAPRDPDIRANLRLALRAAGAAEPDLSGPEIAFTSLAAREWAAVGIIAWWAACALLALAVLFRRRRRLLLPPAALAAAVALGALAGTGIWRGFERTPECVVVGPAQSALAAPEPAAAPRFPLPEGSIVRGRAARGEWVEVTSGQLAGWIRRASCLPVLPAAGAQ